MICGDVEVTFAADGKGTRVTLVHSGWQKLGEKGAAARAGYGEGWTVVLGEAFAAACAIKTGGFWIALAGVVGSDIALAKVGMVVGVLIGGPLYHAWLSLIMLRLAKGLP